VNSYGGGLGTRRLCRLTETGGSAALKAGSSRDALPASTYTPKEARMAEQYARDAMADANWPSLDEHYGSTHGAG